MNRELLPALNAIELKARIPDPEMAGAFGDKLHSFTDLSLREFLHTVPGLGQEASDVVMLYVFGRPIFPIETSVYRVLLRHRLIDADADYFAIQEYCSGLFGDVKEMQIQHQKLQWVGKTFCKKTNPDCERCPLREVNGGPQL